MSFESVENHSCQKRYHRKVAKHAEKEEGENTVNKILCVLRVSSEVPQEREKRAVKNRFTHTHIAKLEPFRLAGSFIGLIKAVVIF
jgi:hypothetical protein